RLRQGRALEQRDQNLSQGQPVLDLWQGEVPRSACLRSRLPTLQVLRISPGQAGALLVPGLPRKLDPRWRATTQMNDDSPVLELKGLCKSFGGLPATRNVTLSIRPGDRKAIIGPNGAGKTTLFNLITGIYPVTSGQVLLFGQDVTKWPSHRRTALGMARTFQITSLFPKLTVLDNVLLAIKGLRPSKFVMWRFLSSYKDVYDKAHHLLEQANFLDRKDVEVRNLSHGEQRQLEIVLGLASDPKILLLDEPAAGLSSGESTE